jgi:hypothetical protein
VLLLIVAPFVEVVPLNTPELLPIIPSTAPPEIVNAPAPVFSVPLLAPPFHVVAPALDNVKPFERM